MKRSATSKRSSSWTNQKVISTLVVLFVVCPFLNLSPPQIMSQPTPPSAVSSSKNTEEIEYEVKAAFIYNFIKFVEWPEEKNKSINSTNPMTIAILGNNPFGSSFDPILGKEAHGRKIHLVEIPSFHKVYETSPNKEKAFTTYQEEYQVMIDSCDVLFICDSEKDHLDKLFSLTWGKMILTISDLPEFAKKDGIIGFVKDNSKIRFEINLDIARKEGIEIRSQLLSLAKKIYETK